ncbi:MAG: winged helix-turn-helix domain-containing protein [Terriglobia bacterium]
MAKSNGFARKMEGSIARRPGAPAAVPSRWRLSRMTGFDRLIHEQTRLGIVSALAVNNDLSFKDLKQILKTTDGNLSVHARKLEAAGYVTCHKFFQGRMPKTEYRLAPAGRRALENYLEQMEALIQAARIQQG